MANARSAGQLSPYDGYVPNRVVSSARPGGGVRTDAATLPGSAVPVPRANDPRANAQGLVGYPNVDIAGELVEARQAVHSYKANLTVLAVAQQMSGALLDREA